MGENIQNSKLLLGRPSKRSHLAKAKISFKVELFCTVLAHVGGDPTKWSLKNEWVKFVKIYFDTSRVRDKHARSAYDFFKKYKCSILHTISLRDNPGEVCHSETRRFIPLKSNGTPERFPCSDFIDNPPGIILSEKESIETESPLPDILRLNGDIKNNDRTSERYTDSDINDNPPRIVLSENNTIEMESPLSDGQSLCEHIENCDETSETSSCSEFKDNLPGIIISKKNSIETETPLSDMKGLYGDTKNNDGTTVIYSDTEIDDKPAEIVQSQNNATKIGTKNDKNDNKDSTTAPKNSLNNIDESESSHVIEQCKKHSILFPKLEKISNTILFINCDNCSVPDEFKQQSDSNMDVKTFSSETGKLNAGEGQHPCMIQTSGAKQENEENNIVLPLTTPEGDDVKVHVNGKDKNIKNETDSPNTDNESFTVQEHCSIDFDRHTWEDLYKGCQVKQNGDEVLPSSWTDVFANALSEVLPFCCIVFKRHKIYKNDGSKIAKFWYYCRTEGCELDGTATLDKSYRVDILNKKLSLKHVKGKPKSFQSRYIKGDCRKNLGERAADMNYPSKLFHRKLSALDDNLFAMGNLKDVPQSKNVIKQCGYEHRKANRVDEALMSSLNILKSKYDEEMKCKSVSGYIQFISSDPLTIGLWSEKDIELFHEMVRSYSLLVDATGSVCNKVNGKEIFYFSFISYDRSIKTEPVPHLEILTDRSSATTLIYLFLLFLEDEMKRYGYTSHSTPVLCTTDCSWPILKCLIEGFNNEKLEQYSARSYKIVSGEANESDLPSSQTKTFVHISLCHSMKSFSRKINKIFKIEKDFVKFSMSLLANSGNLTDIFSILEALFTILLSK